jgi:hypothetical protein
MKRISQADRERLLLIRDRLARARFRETLRCRPRIRKIRKEDHTPVCESYLQAPKVFDCDSHERRQDLVRFFSALRAHFQHRANRALLIDFTRTTRFIAGGTLLFYAELTRLIDYQVKKVKLRCNPPANNRASQVLEQIGIFDLCGHKSSCKPTREDVVHWRVARGHLVDNTICAPVIEAFEEQITPPMVNELLKGLAEAMANAIHHAYDSVRVDGLDYSDVKDWWMFTQGKDGYLSVVFCDLGVGIPATLPVKRPWLMEKIGFAATDADCIREAINEGRSQTGIPGRGHGLGNIIDVVENVPKGIAVVLSNRGRYDSRDGRTKSEEYRDSIQGTLIYWRVPLRERYAF